MPSQQDTFGFLLADVFRLMRRAFEQQLEGCPLTLAQARVLLRLSRQEGLRQVELAELLDIQPITLARQIDQLAATGLVKREPDPRDRRAYQLFLTEAAAPHLEAARQVIAVIRQQALGGLDETQVDTLYLALNRIRENLGHR